MKFGNQLFVISTFFSFMLCSTTNAGIQAQATRVIYESTSSAATLSLKNNSEQAYMVQTWLTQSDENKDVVKIPMVVVPPLLKIGANKESILRFIYSGQSLPLDKETLFWVNIQEIPPKPTEDNALQIAIRTKLKLFYRPNQIQMTLDEAAKKVQWYREGPQLKLKNLSPLHITIGVITDQNGKVISDLDNDMVAPNQTITVINNFINSSKSISYTYINDFGGATTISSKMIE